jgi:pimeloyl-ACP methyl ester carboxylesterase
MRKSWYGIVLCAVVLASGCGMFRVKQDLWRMERAAELRGDVTGASKRKPVVVLLIRDHWGKRTIFHYSVRYGSGAFQFSMAPGTAYLFAFEDLNEDQRYQKGEPAAWFGGTTPQKITLNDGEIAGGLTIRLSNDDLREIELVAPLERPVEGAVKLGRYTYSSGEVTDLDDKRFTEEQGKKGLLEPVHTAMLNGLGVYFLEPYDPKKVPVLFVHGAGGYPQEFRTLIEHLDRSKFQPWVLQYPSGFRLDESSDFLVKGLVELYAKHKFRKLVIVAHSMGGLLSRAAINKIATEYPDNPIVLFITLSTPWDGVDAAAIGVEYSPMVIPCWVDVAPNSPFLQTLFERPLPKAISFYLLFGVVGGNGTDGAVPLTSEISLRAQADAVRIYGYPETHTSILRSDPVILRVNTLLQKAL